MFSVLKKPVDDFTKTLSAFFSPKTLKTIYLINEFESEVNNGGFLQFFTNSSGKYTNETIESLELIEANYTKNLLEKAVRIMLKNNESTESLNTKISSRELYEIFETSEIYDNEVLMKELNDLDSKFKSQMQPLSDSISILFKNDEYNSDAAKVLYSKLKYSKSQDTNIVLYNKLDVLREQGLDKSDVAKKMTEKQDILIKKMKAYQNDYIKENPTLVSYSFFLKVAI